MNIFAADGGHRPGRPRLALAVACVLAGCAMAGEPAGPVPFAIDCDRVLETAPEGTTVPVGNAPRLVNRGAVLERLMRLYTERFERAAVVQLLVQPDGRVSHGCVRRTSWNPRFDRAALEAAKGARFQPAVLDGRRVPAWVAIPVSLQVHRGP